MINLNYEPTSVIMPVLNQLEYTKKCIESIQRNTSCEYEFIIIDNNSTDGTKEYLEELKNILPNLVVITNEENIGVAPAWNAGINIAKYNYLCIINNDIEILFLNWLENMQLLLKKNPNVYWTSPMTCYNDARKPEFKKNHYEQLLYDHPYGRDYIVACCFMCPKQAFNELGLFDEKFEVKFYEDLDYLARILNAGKQIKMCKQALVYHAVGTTSRITAGGHGNEAYFNSKHGNSKYNLDFFAPHIKLQHLKRVNPKGK